mgnify:CR=1 FL=1
MTHFYYRDIAQRVLNINEDCIINNTYFEWKDKYIKQICSIQHANNNGECLKNYYYKDDYLYVFTTKINFFVYSSLLSKKFIEKYVWRYDKKEV